MTIYNFDPTLAPQGKTVVKVKIETHYEYWKDLVKDRESYDAEKERIAQEVIQRLEERFPGFAAQVEMIDVASPATFERYTGNWQASYEGFLPTPKSVGSPFQTLCLVWATSTWRASGSAPAEGFLPG